MHKVLQRGSDQVREGQWRAALQVQKLRLFVHGRAAFHGKAPGNQKQSYRVIFGGTGVPCHREASGDKPRHCLPVGQKARRVGRSSKHRGVGGGRGTG